MRNPIAEKVAKWRERNPERDKEIQRRSDAKRDNSRRAKQWRLKNAHKRLEYNAKNLHRHSAQQGKRRAISVQATPIWADMEKIRALYVEAQKLGLEVDHIVPLRSRRVCGLHVEANLQLLTPEANRRKRNFWWPDMFEESRDL